MLCVPAKRPRPCARDVTTIRSPTRAPGRVGGEVCVRSCREDIKYICSLLSSQRLYVLMFSYIYAQRDKPVHMSSRLGESWGAVDAWAAAPRA